jgi:hypothetical protein
MPGVPVTPATPEAAALAARRAATERQLDTLLDVRGPVAEVRRLVADLDRIAEDLATTLRDSQR